MMTTVRPRSVLFRFILTTAVIVAIVAGTTDNMLNRFKFKIGKNNIGTVDEPSPNKAKPMNEHDLALAVANSINEFSINIYKEIVNSGSTGNVFISPLSIFAALLMVYAGTPTTSDLYNDMTTTMKLPDAIGQTDVCRGYGALEQKVFNSTDDYILAIGNRLFADTDFSIKQEYQDDLEKYFNNEVVRLAIHENAAGARKLINKWVAKQTRQMIQQLVRPGDVHSGTGMVLVNALVFEGEWLRKFNDRSTGNEKFTRLDGTTVNTPTMYLRDHGNHEPSFRLYEDADLDATFLEMFYKGETTSMVVILPKATKGLPKLEKQLTYAKLNTVLDNEQMKKVLVFLRIPKFQMRFPIGLRQVLMNMKMESLFKNPDVSKMTDMGFPCNDVIHEGFVNVDEFGTKAAAATFLPVGVTIGPTTHPFIANHPFMFLIRHIETKTILFMGRVAEPEAGKNSEMTECESETLCGDDEKCCGCQNMFQYQDQYGKIQLDFPSGIVGRGFCWSRPCVENSDKCQQIIADVELNRDKALHPAKYAPTENPTAKHHCKAWTEPGLTQLTIKEDVICKRKTKCSHGYGCLTSQKDFSTKLCCPHENMCKPGSEVLVKNNAIYKCRGGGSGPCPSGYKCTMDLWKETFVCCKET